MINNVEDNEKQELLDILQELKDEFVMQVAMRFDKSPSNVISGHYLVIKADNIIAKYNPVNDTILNQKLT